jgi:hypothetical protein
MQNQNTPLSTTRVGLKYGFFTAIATLVIGLVFALLFRSGGESGFTIFIFAIGIVYGMLEFRRANEGLLSYLQAFNLGMIVSVMSGLCIGLMSALSIAFVPAKDLAKIKDMYLQQFEMQGYSDTQLEAMKPMVNFMFSTSGAFMGTLIGWTFLGFLMTVLIGVFMQRKEDIA